MYGDQNTIIARYEKRGHKVDDVVEEILQHLTHKFQKGNFVIPLVPFYLHGILESILDHQASPQQEIITGAVQDHVLFPVLGNHSFCGCVARDPVLGYQVFKFAKKIFFRNRPDISYQEVFSRLGWGQFDDLFALIFNRVPLFPNYRDLPHFQKNWEFASIAGLLMTRLTQVINLDEKSAEENFLTVLMSDLGKAVIYWELPRSDHGREGERYLRGAGPRMDPKTHQKITDLKLNDDLFKEIIWHWHSLVSGRAITDAGLGERVAQHIFNHHQPGAAVPNDLRLVKFIYRVTNHIIKNGLCYYERDQELLTQWSEDYSLGLSQTAIENFITLVAQTEFGILETGIYNEESNRNAVEGGQSIYDSVDDLHSHVHILHAVKSKLLDFDRAYLFPAEGKGTEHVKKLKRVNIMDALLIHDEPAELAKAVEIPENILMQEIEVFQL